MRVLYDFTRAISAGITMLRTAIRSILPNLYLVNSKESTENTPLVYSGDYPNIHPQSYGSYLDLLGGMFNLTRNSLETDAAFRTRIVFFLSENATIEGISRSIKQIFSVNGIQVDVDIRENHKYFFDGTSTSLSAPMRSPRDSLLYGITVVITPSIEELSSVSLLNFNTLQKETIVFPLTTKWRVRRNPYTGSIISSFKIDSLRYLIDDISAAGVRVDSVVVTGLGTSAATAPITFIEKPRGYASIDLGEIPDGALMYDGIPLIFEDEYLVLT